VYISQRATRKKLVSSLLVLKGGGHRSLKVLDKFEELEGLKGFCNLMVKGLESI